MKSKATRCARLGAGEKQGLKERQRWDAGMGTTGTTRVRTLVSKQQPDAGRVPAAGAAGVRCGTRIPGWRSETGVDDSSEASGRVEWMNGSGNYSHGLPNICHGRYRSGELPGSRCCAVLQRGLDWGRIKEENE